MKYFLAFVSGFCLTLIVFVSGSALTIVYLTAEPVPVRPFSASASHPWTNEPVRITAGKNETHKPTPPESGTANVAMQAPYPGEVQNNEPDLEPAIDPLTTASAGQEAMPRPMPEQSAAHIAWCSERYRSYDPVDNSYNAYSGETRECVSPFSKASIAANSPGQVRNIVSASSEEASAFDSAATMQEMPGAYLDPEHIRACFARYRSYRPEDNTYQPYGGGPRRQCD
ncbi:MULTISPECIES: BA14K family protein [Chelativorans]|nr:MULTISPECIES: BA14K family protein [Chelativorans]